MKKILLILTLVLSFGAVSMAATEQAKQQAIDNGLAWLASTMTMVGDEGYFPYSNDGTLAATASAALAFIEEGYLPGDGSVYGDEVEKMCNYIFNRGKVDTNFTALGAGGTETAGYTRIAEDYNNNGILDPGEGNNQAIFFDPSFYKRDIYTNGIVAPVVYALGEAYGENTVVGRGSATVSGMTYKQVMRDLVDWYSYGQVEPTLGNQRGGWRYTPNYASSDNSTAQWGALTMLYGESWGLNTPDYVKNELELWVNYIQDPVSGGSGYSYPTQYVNEAKTGGLLLQLKLLDPVAGINDSRVQDALSYLNTYWNRSAFYSGSTWYAGNLGNPYSMWAIYKALELWGVTEMANAPDAGAFLVGQDWAPTGNAADDWFAHYCEWLVNNQNSGGYWNGYAYWSGALAAGWNINILNASGVPQPPGNVVPEPTTMVLFGFGLLGVAGIARRQRHRV